MQRAGVLRAYGLPSGVTSAAQIKKVAADALTEAVPRLATKSHTNRYTQAWASGGHVLGWVATKSL